MVKSMVKEICLVDNLRKPTHGVLDFAIMSHHIKRCLLSMQPHLSGEHMSGRHMSGHFFPGEHLSGYVSSGLGMVTTCLPKARDGHHMSA